MTQAQYADRLRLMLVSGAPWGFSDGDFYQWARQVAHEALKDDGIPCEDCGASAGVPCACDSAPYTDGEPAQPLCMSEPCALNATKDVREKTRIRLFRAGGAWMAQFVGDPEMIAAFGTDTIPTAFRDCAQAGTVYQAISKRNPGALVDVYDGPVVGTGAAQGGRS
jgi:hypothetical protein